MTETQIIANESKVGPGTPPIYRYFIAAELILFFIVTVATFIIYDYEPHNEFIYVMILVFWLTISIFFFYQYNSKILE